MNFSFCNHWKCLKDWFEFTLLRIIVDPYPDYFYLEITIINFEFVVYSEKKNNLK